MSTPGPDEAPSEDDDDLRRTLSSLSAESGIALRSLDDRR
jgi:hypothetical protein